MFQTQQNILTPAMHGLLRGMAALYNQAKSDGKLERFIGLACQTLWEGDPLYAAPQTPNTLRYRRVPSLSMERFAAFEVPSLHTLISGLLDCSPENGTHHCFLCL